MHWKVSCKGNVSLDYSTLRTRELASYSAAGQLSDPTCRIPGVGQGPISPAQPVFATLRKPYPNPRPVFAPDATSLEVSLVPLLNTLPGRLAVESAVREAIPITERGRVTATFATANGIPAIVSGRRQREVTALEVAEMAVTPAA